MTDAAVAALLARVAEWRKQYETDTAVAELERALAGVAPGSATFVDVSIALAGVHRDRWETDRSLDHALAARAAAESLGDERRVITALRAEAATRTWTAPTDATGVALGDEALARAERLGDEVLLVDVLVELAGRAWNRGDVGATATAAARAVTLARHTGDDESLVGATTLLALVAGAEERWTEAAAAHAEALAFYRARRWPEHESLAHNNLGSVALATGNRGTAAAHFSEALRIRRALGRPELVVPALIALGVALALAGDTGGACAALEEAATTSASGIEGLQDAGAALAAALRGRPADGDVVAAVVDELADNVCEVGDRASRAMLRELLVEADRRR